MNLRQLEEAKRLVDEHGMLTDAINAARSREDLDALFVRANNIPGFHASRAEFTRWIFDLRAAREARLKELGVEV